MDDDVYSKPAASPTQPPRPPPPLIIKADELDSTGTDVSTPVPDASTPITPAQQVPPLHPPQSLSPQPMSSCTSRPAPARPILRREASTPAPPSQPPPPTPQQRQQASDDDPNPTDSLSLQQLRQLVTNLPRLDPQAYAYEHADTRSFAEEAEEWFPYSDDERYMLLRGKEAFETQWERWQGGSTAPKWTQAEDKDQELFLQHVIETVDSKDEDADGVECLAYLAMGCWGETAGVDEEKSEEKGVEDPETGSWGGMEQGQPTKSATQIKWIRKGCEMLVGYGAAQVLFKVLRKACDGEQEAEQASGAVAADETHGSTILHRFLAINQALTALYLMVEVGRWSSEETKAKVRQALDMEAGILGYLTQVIARTRWQDSPRLPFTRILLLYWKVILLMFGGSEELNESKRILQVDTDSTMNDDNEPLITASPLDYHLFRQEITSKYPAYNPPQPLIPIELENNSILPPLPSHPSRRTSQEKLTTTSGPTVNGTPGSIFKQPVHIATPAPSPPPSPAASGGKGGKKQNYQTNQNFPFLYPPLDETSNIVGGKGSPELQEQLVRKRWEGSDVPASILEAGQLFASRMRMSRSIRQLWDVRERFIRHERGWNEVAKDGASSGSSGSIIDEEGASDDLEREADLADVPGRTRSVASSQLDTSDENVRRRLDAIEEFYRNALPHLQSVVLVLWKIIFTNVSYMAAQANGTNGVGVPNGISFPEDNPDSVPVKRKINVHSGGQDEMGNGHPAESDEEVDPVLEELNSMRLREVSSKAISATLLMLLKWFKLSHILKYEYLTQLLLDANYLPLILKYFAHQDVDRAVDQKIDRDDMNFFHFCHLNSNQPPAAPHILVPSPSPSSPDSAAPPPIPTHRRTHSTPSSSSPSPPLKPSVDELGYPTAPLPALPLTTYSPRFFHTTTTLLRLLQKITKHHAHRSLLLVQYKSSTILRRHLKIPQPQLRLYTLKLFKHQVPFCGRKWRQSNMRVITAVYLHVRGELRDEWLAGGDVDTVVEEAVPVEQSWRSLVHWWHLREYRDMVEPNKGGKGKQQDEGGGGDGEEEDAGDVYDFFARELEKMGWGTAGGGGGGGPGSLAGEEGDDQDEVEGESEWDGGPLQLEGWT